MCTIIGPEPLSAQDLAFSTLAQATGGVKDIQAQMRHSRPDTTASIYMQTIPAQQEQAVRLLEEMILGKTTGRSNDS